MLHLRRLISTRTQAVYGVGGDGQPLRCAESRGLVIYNCMNYEPAGTCQNYRRAIPGEYFNTAGNYIIELDGAWLRDDFCDSSVSECGALQPIRTSPGVLEKFLLHAIPWGAGGGLTNGGSLIEVSGGELCGGVDAGPAPEHDALEAGAAVQALLRLLVGLLVVAVLRLGAFRLVDGQVAACITNLVMAALVTVTLWS